MEEEVATAVKDSASAASILNHVRNNRIEYLLAIGLLHLIGVSDSVFTAVSGVCF